MIRDSSPLRSSLLALTLTSVYLSYLFPGIDLSRNLLVGIATACIIGSRRCSLSLGGVVPLVVGAVLLVASWSLHETDAFMSYSVHFALLSVIGLLLCSGPINIVIVSKICTVILGLSLWWSILFFGNTEDAGTLLGASYALVGPLACCAAVAVNRDLIVAWRLAALCVALVLSFELLIEANRGAIVCLGALGVLYLATRGTARRGVVIWRYCVLGVACWLVIQYGGAMLLWVSERLAGLGVNSRAVEHSIDLESRGASLDSGRAELIERGISLLSSWEHWMFGRGVGYFEEAVGTYVHNLAIECLVEGGLLYCLFPLATIGRCLIALVSKREDWPVLIVGLCVGVVPLMLSSVYWTFPAYWLFVYYVWCGRAAFVGRELATTIRTDVGVKG